MTTDRPKSRSLGPLRALVPYLRPYRGVLVLALVALLAALLGVSSATAQTNPVWPYPGQSPGTPAPLDAPLLPTTQPQFIARLPIPVDYTPEKALFAPFDYYEIAYAPVTAVGRGRPSRLLRR